MRSTREFLKDLFEAVRDTADAAGPRKAAKVAFDKVTRRYLGGHVTLGPLTLYGNNAMQWAANLRVPALGVTLCAKAPAPFNRGRGWYFYASPNATPWAAVLGCGPGMGPDLERVKQRLSAVSDAPHERDEIEKLASAWGFDLGWRPGGATDSPYIGTEN